MVAKTGKPAKTGSRNAQDKGMVQRLKDQRTVFRNAQAIHENPSLLKQRAFYPAHDARKETPLYKKAHDHLTKTLDLPCLVCGVKNSTLQDKAENRYGAKAMETHHHIIEWALANAIDAAKFNKIILPHLKTRHPQNPDYAKAAFNDDDVRAWVDHSEDNLWVLCDVHHRAGYLGIHEITYPIWCPVDLLRSDFEEYVRQQIQLNKPAAKGAAKKKPAKKATKKAKKAVKKKKP
ncbi:MAG TPA: hypothetical protein VNU97_04215 [Rhizomicrobium sp.]|jgi:hypothetical protein|nr:hypothetical protein [Rhizomicrobium sp.]